MRRSGTLLSEHPLYEPVETELSSNIEFIHLKALKNLNANIKDIENYITGKFPQRTLDIITAFYIGEQLYQNHSSDAFNIEAENRRRLAAAKAQNKNK